MLKKFWLIQTALFIAIMVLAMPARAEQKSGIQISPVTFDTEIKPGASQLGKLTVKNLDGIPMDYALETELFADISEDGAPSFQGVKKPDGVSTLADWISFSVPITGTIAPYGSLETSFTIDVPANAEPGGHYAAIFAKSVKKDPEGNTQLGVASRVGMIVLVTVPGSVTEGGEIISFSHPTFTWKGPVDFGLKFKNNGTVHYDSSAKVEIKPWLGKTREVDLGKHTVLPKTIRAYSGSWNNHYPFGYYQLSATANDGSGKLVTTTGSFWAIPLTIVIPVVLLVLLLWGIMIYVKQNYQVVKK